ncbi:MAG: hypothetical protein HY059_17530 [Proteobacteria bacterium]|nr:hypothetical protein [Pseudomonadota bacterium]
MDTGEILFLGLVLFAFAAFSVTVMWVLHDDVRNSAKRAANEAVAAAEPARLTRAA